MSAPTIKSEPVDELRHTFTADRRLALDDGPRKFTEIGQASTTPVAEAVLSIEGVAEVILEGPVVTVVRDASGPGWSHLVPRIEYALTAAFFPTGPVPGSTSASAPAEPRVAGPVSGDDAIYDEVEEIFREEINPIVAQHGGAIDLIDVQDATVVVRMSGGCQGCGMANVTLRQGIEAALRKAIPGLNGVRDVTDHASGNNPYFASSGK